MAHMAYSSRDLARRRHIYEMMLRDTDCGVILCLAGSLISAGLQKVVVDLVRNNMVDAIVSTGANIVDQDFFEALGFQHYIAGDEYKYGGERRRPPRADDRPHLRHFIDEEELRICDETTEKITNSLEVRPYCSREFIRASKDPTEPVEGSAQIAGADKLARAVGARVERVGDLLGGVVADAQLFLVDVACRRCGRSSARGASHRRCHT